jgi:hypothetical protein
MAVLLNKPGYDHAKKLIEGKLEVVIEPDGWEEHKPTPDEISKYLNTHDIQDYALWFLGTDTTFPKDYKEHYVYPHGDLKIVHYGALLAAEEESAKKGHSAIHEAARKLIDLIDQEL